MQRIRTSGVVLAGVVGLAGVGVGAVVGPAAASAAGISTKGVTDRVSTIKNALSGLVKDGTLTQAQADKVASTLDGALPKDPGGPGFGRGFGHGFGPGFGGGFGPGADLDTAASVIGITADQLRTDLQGGKTLAQVAQGKGITQATLVDKLVAAAKTQITAAVKAGRLTQAQADKITSDLQARITKLVTSTRPAGGPGRQGPWNGGGPNGGGRPPAAGATPPANGGTT